MVGYWHLQLLGGLCLRSAETTLSRFRTHKTGALLAYLAYYTHHSHPREVLIDLLWPEAAPPAGARSLRVALTSLRHQLEPPGIPAGTVLRADRFSVGLNPGAITTDVREFEDALRAARQARSMPERVQSLAEAVEVYRGELLPGYYEGWILAEQQRLEAVFLEAVGELVQALADRGEWERALGYAQGAIRVEPLWEEGHGHIMRLQGVLGRPEIALRQYETLKRLLEQELGTSPGEATGALAQALQAQSGSQERGRGSRSPVLADGLSGAWPLSPPPSASQGQAATPPLNAQAEDPSHLPLQWTRFFGREAEMGRLAAMLTGEGERLVTLWGPAGSGKTRLAIETARPLVQAFEGAVWFVPLADLVEASLMADAVLKGLGLPRTAEQEPMEQVVAALSARPSLLVLDNFEHLVEEGASVVRLLLERVPTLTCLVTSRQPLELSGEQRFPVEPLPTPQGGEPPEELLGYASVRLFVDRAQTVKPDFQVTARNGAAIGVLCDRLDGIPLALELAASSVQVLTPGQMLEELEHRFDFLVSRRRDGTERHRTLKAAVEWSYRLLPTEAQRFFKGLSVFRGGWNLAAAGAVCEEPLALELLGQLVACSLVLSEETDQGMRYRMLETFREYGMEQLAPEERRALSRSHARYYMELAEKAEPVLHGPLQRACLERLEQEHNNMRAAILWSQGVSGEAELGLRLAGALGWFWFLRGYWHEGRTWLEGMLALEGGQARTAWRAKALSWAGELASWQGEYPLAGERLEASLAIYREVGDKRGIAWTLLELGRMAAYLGEGDQTGERWTESLALFQELGDKAGTAQLLSEMGSPEEALALFLEVDDKRGMAWSLLELGWQAAERGEYVQGRTQMEEGLALFQEVSDKGGMARTLLCLGSKAYEQEEYALARARLEDSEAIHQEVGNKDGYAYVLSSLGFVALQLAEHTLAQERLDQALRLFQETGARADIAFGLVGLARLALRLGDAALARERLDQALPLMPEPWPQFIAAAMECAAGVLCAEGQPERAACLLGAAEALREAYTAPLPPVDRADYDRRVAAVRDTLSEAGFATAWARGRKMSWEEAIAYARGVSRQESDPSPAAEVSDALWEQIRPLLPSSRPKKTGRPSLADRQAMTAILYVLRTGCPWKALPPGLGKASTVHDRYQEWRRAGVFERMRQAGLLEGENDR